MRLTFPARAAVRAAWLAAVARAFCGLVLGDLHNGAWGAALAGAALAALVLRGLDALLRRSPAPLRGGAMAAALLPPLLADLLFAAHVLTGSAEFLALETTHALAPRVLLPLVLGWLVFRKGAGVLYGGMLWLKLLPLLFVPVLLLQFPHYRPDWLFPLLGDGMGALLPAALRTAEWLVLPFAAQRLLSGGEPGDDRLFGPATAGTVVALLILLRLMMTPAMPGVLDASWLNRLDSLLTNGRAPLYLQLPMIVVWTIGLMNLAAFDALAGATCLQRLAPGLDGRWFGGALAAFAFVGLLGLETSRVVGGRCEGLALLPFAVAATLRLRRREAAPRSG